MVDHDVLCCYALARCIIASNREVDFLKGERTKCEPINRDFISSREERNHLLRGREHFKTNDIVRGSLKLQAQSLALGALLRQQTLLF